MGVGGWGLGVRGWGLGVGGWGLGVGGWGVGDGGWGFTDKVLFEGKKGSSRFCVISLTYNMIDQSLCPLCLCGSFHPLARRNVS